MSRGTRQDAVRGHLKGFWPSHRHEEFAWTLGPISQRLPEFRVRRVDPAQPNDPWVYATVGASEINEGGGDGLEFFMLSPSESPRHVETLAMIANFHADPRYGLSVGQMVNIGRPWLDGATADHLLVSLPYPYGPNLEHCSVPGHHVRFLWLVPITANEARYARDNGVEALEQLLEHSDVDVISPVRRSLA